MGRKSLGPIFRSIFEGRPETFTKLFVLCVLVIILTHLWVVVFFSIKSIGCYTSYVIHKRTVLFWWLLYRRLLCYFISLSSPHWRQTSTDVFSTFSFCLPHIARYLYTSICFLHPHNNFSNVDSNAHLSPTLSYSRVFSEWTHWHGSTGQDGRVQHYKIH